ncbi:hypothetical protein [Pseudoflavonifractor phocaeensis]|uniref:hypothetical protein n=1 Tax=Pseudoflavonifractor phocaeensis TaxID=1870988 RepID=UPI0021099BBD|nr:hypothetical protein [Pseudoflavonifractor phocaeensis]MCQ4863495.1 hypothetical protein [Pseudoflavonifractor phocaeensis]
MLVKIIDDHGESEWFPLTKKKHRALLERPPQAVTVKIDDLYPESPERGQLVTLEFQIFNTLAREFMLMELCQEKRKERHHDKRSIDAIDPGENQALTSTLEAEFERNELRQALAAGAQQLTPTQRRRMCSFYLEGLSCREIATREHASHTSVVHSIQAAKKKMQKTLELYGFQRPIFCRIK